MSDMEYLFTEWEAMLKAIQTHEGRNKFIEVTIEKLRAIEYQDEERGLISLGGIDFLKVRHFLNSLSYNLHLFTKFEEYRKLVYAIDRDAWESLFVLSKRFYSHCLMCGFHDTNESFAFCPQCGKKQIVSDLFGYLTDTIMREKRGDKEISYRI